MLSTAAWSQVGGPGTVVVGGGGGGVGVTGLTSCADGTALADNALMRADGTTKCQGSTVTVADLSGNLQWEGTTADAFEGNFTFADPTADWTWAWGADGALTGATQFNLENLRLDGNTISTTNSNGDLVLAPNGTGAVSHPVGSATLPGISFTGDPDTGFYWESANSFGLGASGTRRLQVSANGLNAAGSANLWAEGTTGLWGFKALITASTAGSGAPAAVNSYDSQVMNTNEGATARNYRTLVTAASGYQPRFCVQDADGIRIVANTGDTIRVIDKVTAAAGYIESTTIGSCVSLISLNATEWFAESIHGTWTDGTFTYDDTGLTTP